MHLARVMRLIFDMKWPKSITIRTIFSWKESYEDWNSPRLIPTRYSFRRHLVVMNERKKAPSLASSWPWRAFSLAATIHDPTVNRVSSRHGKSWSRSYYYCAKRKFKETKSRKEYYNIKRFHQPIKMLESRRHSEIFVLDTSKWESLKLINEVEVQLVHHQAGFFLIMT